MGTRRELWLKPGSNWLTFIKPQISYVLTEVEKKMFIPKISVIRTPKRYKNSLTKHLSKSMFMSLKSHDYHCLIQQIILTVSRTTLQPLQWKTLIRLEKNMNCIYARVIDKADIPTLRLYIIETLYYLELYFSLSFFDIIEHSLIHLVDDLQICGPVGGRSLYIEVIS